MENNDFVLGTTHPFNDYGRWMRGLFSFRTQKLSIDAGFTCPNRDGTIGHGGCVFCDNRTFNPSYCEGKKSVARQINDGKAFFARKYPDMKYIAYFQAYTNTYAPLDRLKELYEEALSQDDVVGLSIATRPDCVSAPLLDYLGLLSRQVLVTVEYGIESANDATLALINRGHDFESSRRAVCETAERGIYTGGHVILGLPGEDAKESLRQAPLISALPLTMLKIHQMQVVRGTALASSYAKSPFHLYSVEEYVELVSEYVQRLRADLVLERFVSQSPQELLVAPRWGLKNHEFTDILVNHMKATGAWQGKKVI